MRKKRIRLPRNPFCEVLGEINHVMEWAEIISLRANIGILCKIEGQRVRLFKSGGACRKIKLREIVIELEHLLIHGSIVSIGENTYFKKFSLLTKK